MTNDHAIIHIVPTKLSRPAVDARWVVRPRLLAALDGVLGRKLTLISAPAGYGKSTLVVQWLDRLSQPAAWLSLDEQDSDPDRFLRCLIASIRTLFPQFGSQIEPQLSSPTMPPPEFLADVLISDLNALEEALVLAFDDFHTVRSEPVRTMMARLVQYLPDHLHLVITTRADPPLPLAQWRVRNWLTEIRAADLRFFSKEAQAFFAPIDDKRLSTEAIERILARTEGWVAGLQLARLSLTDADNPDALARSFVGSNRMVVDYLIDEIVSRQTDEVKNFLTVTAMLKRFCAPLCDRLLDTRGDIPDSHRLIAFLEKENLFLVPLDQEGTWYRYHHLFQALLLRKMRSVLSKKHQTRIHRLAGEWFADREYIEDALRHLIAAGDIDAAATLVEKNMHSIIDQDLSRRSLGRWLNLFPKESERGRPGLLLAHGFLRIVRWDMAGTVQLLDQAESLLKDPACSTPETRRLSLLGDIDVQRAQILCLQGDAENGLRHARQGLDAVPKQHRYSHTLAIVCTAGIMALCGQKDDALHLLDRALTEDCSEGSPNAAQLLLAKFVVFSYGADWDAVEESAKRIFEIHKTSPQAHYWLGYAHYFLGSAAYERNLPDAAADHFGRVEQMRYQVNTRLYHDALIGLMLAAWAKEDKETADRLAAAAHSFAIEAKDSFSVQISDSIQIRLAILSGKKPADTAPRKPTADSTRFWLVSPSLTHAEYLVHRGNHRDCSAGLESIEKGLQMARHHHNRRLELQFLAVQAVALKLAGRSHEALDLLERTLSLAEPSGLVRTFVDRGPHMAELLRALSERRPENLHAKSLLDAFVVKVPPEDPATDAAKDPAGTGQPVDAFLSSGLSNRELDVLILLGERLANKEIAGRLYISPITVKAHTAGIYRKLNVHSRRAAVARAKQLGLLSEDSP